MPGFPERKGDPLWPNGYDTLELFVKRKEFLPGSGFLSRRNMT